MDADDLQRTKHNATKLADNVVVMYDALRMAGIERSLREKLIVIYWQMILDAASKQGESATLAALIEGLRASGEGEDV